MSLDARPLLFLGFTMLSFSAVNAYVGFSLYGERGAENRKRLMDAMRELREHNKRQIEESERKAAEPSAKADA